MKTKFISLAATLLLAASVNTAFADDIYLVGPFNNWGSGSNTSDYKFNPVEGQSNVYTLTIDNFGGVNEEQTRFKIKVGSSMLGVNGSTNYWLTKEHPNYSLVNNANASCLYLQFNSSYTFTLENNMLSVNLDDYLIAGSFNNWAPQRMTKQSDGSYTFEVKGGDQFKIRDFNAAYNGGESPNWENNPHEIKDVWHTNINMISGGANFKINDSDTHTVVVKDGKLTVLGYTIYFDETLSYGSPSSYQNQVCDVQIDERTLYCDGYWNTICLPFNLDDFSSTIFNDAEVMTLESSEFNAGTLTLNFNTANSISAGVPYIVRWSNGGNDIKNPYFYDVTINSTVGQSGTGPATFLGCINPITIPETDCENTDYLYLGAENTLYYPADEASVTIKAFRAYFKLNLPSGQQAKSFVLNFGDDNETTSIKQINNTASATDSYFTLDGRRLNDKPATAGLYIINGKKVVIK